MRRLCNKHAPWTAALLALALVAGGCRGTPAAVDTEPPTRGEPDLRVLFIGNSLTYTNDLPLLVRAVADVLGRTVAYDVVARPGYSLEDHWRGGIEEAIRSAAADVVVLQQGPSSLPENQEHLRRWTERLAEVIREAGGRPALYMVWPSRDRAFAFDDVLAAYGDAADAVDGIFIPAGQAWRVAWEEDPDLALYGPDGFHPSTTGSLLAALVTVRMLLDVSVADLPTTLEPTAPELPTITVPASIAPTLYGAAERAALEWGVR